MSAKDAGGKVPNKAKKPPKAPSAGKDSPSKSAPALKAPVSVRDEQTAGFDVEDVLTRIEAGESQAEIAEALGVHPSTVCRALKRDAETEQRSARAREDSAEAWLDKGMAVLYSALSKESGLDASAARAISQECARRAAIRNPAYRDKVDQTLSAPGGGPVQFQKIERFIIDPKAPK